MIARALLLAVAGGCTLVACGGGSAGPLPAAKAADSAASASSVATGPGPAASAPAVSVSTVRAVRRDVAVQVEATGAVSALSSVDVKPQVASVVTAVLVKEGQFVAKGQPLFTLDGRADAANLARAEAQLLRDQVTLADAQRQLARAQELLAKNFVSQGAVDTAQTQVEAQRAAVAADRAAIEAARVALSYSRLVAPSAGRVGQVNVFPGSSVAPGGAPMVTITQLDPIAVSFNLPQRNLPDALKALAEAGAVGAPAAGASSTARRARRAVAPATATGGGASAAPDPGTVVAVLPDGRGTRVGRLDFVDNAVDPASGTVRVKAVFANQDHALWPGAYVNVQLALQSLPGAVVIPQAAIVQGARGHAVFVVGDDNVAAQRPLKVLQALGTDAAVSGVQPGERLVLDGRQNLRTGTRVSERTAERPAGDQRASADPPRSADAPGSAASRPGPSATGGARTLP